MRKFLLIAALLIAAPLLAAAQNSQGRTPPGGDMLGSDRYVQNSDINSMPTASPDANQRMTHSAGSTTGYENPPAFAGASSSEYRTPQQGLGRIATQSSHRAAKPGEQRKTPGAAKTHRAAPPK